MSKKPVSRLMALVLSAALVFTMIPFTVSVKAAGCTHEHDAECGYVEGHYVEDDDVVEDDDLENDLDEEPATSSNTKPTSPSSNGRYVEGAPCQHVHDELCGGVIDSGKTPGKSGEESELVVIAEFDELDEYTLYQGFDIGEIESQDEIILPDILTGKDSEGKSVTIEGVTWESDPNFDPLVSLSLLDYPNGYIFSPVLPDNYILTEGVTAPVISVFIRPEGGTTPQTMAASVGVIGPGLLTVDRTGAASGSRVYYGGTVWRVVTKESGIVTLFKEGAVDNRQFDTSSNDWSGSEICTWLNGDYLSSAFTARESGIIQTYGSSPDNQEIVLPSEDEVKDGGTWGFTGNSDRVASSSASWWLRTPGDIGYTKAVSGSSGAITNTSVNNNLIVARPAFKLTLNNILFASAASGTGSKSSATTGPELSEAAVPSGAVKLTVTDSGLSLNSSFTNISVDGRTITFSYSGATAGNTLSAVVKSSTGAVKHYGKLADSINASGTTSVTVPDNFIVGSDTLSIFVEKLNGANLTDYASAPVSLTVTQATAPTVVQGTIDGTMKITGVDTTM